MAFAASRSTLRPFIQVHRAWAVRMDASRCFGGRAVLGLHNHSPCRNMATRALSMRIYSSEDCPLCDGLKDKLEALRERAQFQPSDIWQNMRVEAIDVDTDEGLKEKYRMRIPVLAVDAGGEWKELPRQSPRLTADALGKRLEKDIVELLQ